MESTCRVCGETIEVMAHRGDGVCSQLCAKRSRAVGTATEIDRSDFRHPEPELSGPEGE